MKIDEGKLASDVCWMEGLKESISLAQVKEVLRLTLDRLAVYVAKGRTKDVMALIRKHTPKKPPKNATGPR